MSVFCVRHSVFISLASIAAFGIGLRNGFLWDDEVLILGNSLISSFQHVPDLFTSGVWAGSGNYYRPIATLTYLIDYNVWGVESAFGFHLTTLLLHIGISIVLYLLLAKRFSNHAAFFAAVIFAIHPVNTASIVPASWRDNVLVGFCIVALLAFEHSRDSRKAGVICVLAYVLALLSKESGIVFPLIAVAYAFCYFDREQFTRVRWVVVVLFVVAGTYLALRLAWMPFIQSNPLSLIADQPVHVRLWTECKALLLYVGLWLFPATLHTERHFVASFSDPVAWLGLISLLGALIFAWRYRNQHPYLLFGCALFLIPLAPVSNLVRLHVTMGEHWMYVPSMGLTWILAGVLDNGFQSQGHRRRWLVAAAFCAVCCALATRSIIRTLDWRDGMTLYTHDLQYAENSFLLYNNLGVEFARQGRVAEAEQKFRTAVSIEPRYGTATNNLGAMLARKGDLQEAEHAYRAAIALSDYELAYSNLGEMLIKRGELEEAAKILIAGKKAHPHHERINKLLGHVVTQLNLTRVSQ